MWGSHSGDRKTYGHSLIVDPWGEVLADAGEGVGIITADLELSRVEKVRAAIPALAHDRDFLPPSELGTPPRRRLNFFVSLNGGRSLRIGRCRAHARPYAPWARRAVARSGPLHGLALLHCGLRGLPPAEVLNDLGIGRRD